MEHAKRESRMTSVVISTGLSAIEWYRRLADKGYEITGNALDVLYFGYDTHHQYKSGRELNIALICGTEIGEYRERTTENLKSLARIQYGDRAVDDLKGELALLIREKFTDKEMQSMGLQYIAVLHKPVNVRGTLKVLDARRDKSFVDAPFGHSEYHWNDSGAFAFLVS